MAAPVVDLLSASFISVQAAIAGERRVALVPEVVKRLAMARADVGFSLMADGRRVFDVAPEDPSLADDPRLKRLAALLGRK